MLQTEKLLDWEHGAPSCVSGLLWRVEMCDLFWNLQTSTGISVEILLDEILS